MTIDALGSKLKEICSECSGASKLSYTEAFARYGYACPREIEDLAVSFSGGFIRKSDGEHWHFYSPDDLAKAEQHVPIDIRTTGRVPIIDCKDNLFICACPTKGRYVLFDPFGVEDVIETESLQDIISKLGI
jgi:hypothetical protein